jgi:hypothetical protein
MMETVRATPEGISAANEWEIKEPERVVSTTPSGVDSADSGRHANAY